MAEKPVSGTKEWAATSENVMRGCANGCRYCYACANAARFNQREPGDWTREEVNEKALEKGFGKREGTIMFPTTHDLNWENLKYTLPFLRKMLIAGNKVLVVSKPWMRVIQEMCEQLTEYKDQILFRFTIGAPDDDTLAFWEPHAPGWHSRLGALLWAHGKGFQTSVSVEPLLETDEDMVVNGLVWAIEEGVTDSIWIGKANRLEERLRRNGHWENPEVRKKAHELLASQTDDRIRSLYARLKDHPKIKWKESIKKVVGLEIPTEAGLDI